MSVTAGVSDKVMATRDKLGGMIGQTKVKRYWPGKAPEWGANDIDEDGDIHMARVEPAFPSHDGNNVTRKDDPRLRRLAESRIDNRDEVRGDYIRIRQAEIISTADEEIKRLDFHEDDDDEEDALQERRRRIREKVLQRQLQDEEDEEIEYEDESEYETDSEQAITCIVAMVKPVFAPKSERDTIAERDRLEAEERALEEAVKRKIELRKKETREIVIEKIRQDYEIQKNIKLDRDIADVDTDDDANEADEYEAWKRREIGRIKRDRDNREALVKQKEEIERVRSMNEDERREWERKNPKPVVVSKKRKWRFMQMYYHKGAFFQDDRDDIYGRDYSAPTGEDKMDKSILPKVMQVRHFGRRGRTKWSHLVNEDTTDWNSPWTYNDPLRANYNRKMGGMNKPIEKPKGSKKLKDWESFQ